MSEEVVEGMTTKARPLVNPPLSTAVDQHENNSRHGASDEACAYKYVSRDLTTYSYANHPPLEDRT